MTSPEILIYSDPSQGKEGVPAEVSSACLRGPIEQAIKHVGCMGRREICEEASVILCELTCFSVEQLA